MTNDTETETMDVKTDETDFSGVNQDDLNTGCAAGQLHPSQSENNISFTTNRISNGWLLNIHGNYKGTWVNESIYAIDTSDLTMIFEEQVNKYA